MAVEVAADGTFPAGRRHHSINPRSIERIDQGRYKVIFRHRRLHRDCFWTAAIGERGIDDAPIGLVTLNARFGTNNGLWIRTYDLNGNDSDKPFMLKVICAN